MPAAPGALATARFHGAGWTLPAAGARIAVAPGAVSPGPITVGEPMPRPSSRLPLLFLLLAPGAVAAQPATGASAPVPVLFAPLTVDRPFVEEERLLRELLSARMIAGGRYVESASADTEARVQECVRTVNRDTNAESCWIRLGQGQGAAALVSGELRGGPQRCALTLRLTMLETRITTRKHVEELEPCSREALRAEIGRAARGLAGLDVLSPPPPSPAPSSPPAPAPSPPPAPSPSPTPSPAPVVLFGGAATRPAPAPTPLSVGKLDLRGTPAGAEVVLTGPDDRTVRGTLPLQATLEQPGSYRLAVRQTGYLPVEHRVEIEPGRTVTFQVELKPAPSGFALLEGWWALEQDREVFQRLCPHGSDNADALRDLGQAPPEARAQMAAFRMVFLRDEVCLGTGNQLRKCKPANLEAIGPALFRSKDSAEGNATTERVGDHLVMRSTSAGKEHCAVFSLAPR